MITARLRLLAAGLATAVLAAGCGFWSSSKPKLPELPPVSGAASMRTAWSYPIGAGGIGFQPLVVGDSVLAASRAGVVARLDAESGRVAWRVELGKPLIAGVGSDGTTTVVAARDGSLIALDRDGAQRWSTQAGAEIVTVPAVGLGLAIVRASDNRVSAFDLETGKRRWTFDRQSPALVLRQTAAIAMDTSSAYVGLPGGRLVALSLQSGAQRWEAAIGLPRGSNEIERIADVVGSPLISGGEVCAAAWQGRIACLDTSTGRAAWGRDLAAAAGIDLDSRQVVAVDSDGVLHSVSRSGASLWRQDALKRRQPSAPLLAASQVLVGDSLGMLHLLSRDDGALLARSSTDGSPIVGAPARWRNLAIVQTSGGSLQAVALD
ncbi:outer membrane protein assembly factor BamB [Burkholderiaceae bacterium FT117]|uniref:outer membrane protein assembly factor BamB n=1 Tax=Zeimonas sediminis TaxID=2944268 RepID=UPI002342ED69|nr:outer membrane protein assembly factor BamB [Zeimonas sediminis]MCM5571931.1 outer membrane protein assembly factor BamB [Zeimonas sediminis]